jgi:hypothetical protein
MAQNLAQLTDMWMVDPTMFDPTQKSNQFSNFNNNPFPWPPSYNTGAGGPVNAATGKPIASFQQWQQQNPGGMSLNSTPAQPQAAAQPSGDFIPPSASNPLAAVNPAAFQGSFAGGVDPTTGMTRMQANQALNRYYNPTPMSMVGGQSQGWGGTGGSNVGGTMMGPSPASMQPPWAGQASQAAPQQQASGAPNNWQAAINALANPGNPVTQGANVPLATGYQPAGGVNQAFLNQAGAGQNQNFLSALRAIQGRPQ